MPITRWWNRRLQHEAAIAALTERATVAEQRVHDLTALNEALRDLLLAMRPAVADFDVKDQPKTIEQSDAEFVARTKENKK